MTQEQHRTAVADPGGQVAVDRGDGTDVFLRIDKKLVLTHEETARRLAETIYDELGGEE